MSTGPASTSRSAALVAAAAILAFVVAYVATGYLTLDPASRAVPILAGVVTIGLLLIELLRLARIRPSAAPTSEATGTTNKEWKVLASVIALVVGIYLVGFLIAVPLYMALAIWLLGAKPLRLSIAVTVIVSGVIYGAFVAGLSLRLYPGILFGA